MPRSKLSIISIAVGLAVALVAGFLSVDAWGPSSQFYVAEQAKARGHFENLLPEALDAGNPIYATNSEGGYGTDAFAFDISHADFLRMAQLHGGSAEDFTPFTGVQSLQALLGPAFSIRAFHDRLAADFDTRSAEFYSRSEGSDGESWIYDFAHSRGYVMRWTG